MDATGGEGGSRDASAPVSFLGRCLPAWVQLHVVVIPPGCAHAVEPGQWRGAMIVVERGTVELELRCGRRLIWAQGYIGTLSGMSPEALHNTGDRPAVITAVSRATRAQAPGTSTSTASSCPLGRPDPGA